MDQHSVVMWSLWTGIISALATGLGAIPVHFVKNNSKILRAFSCAFAGGMMISASVFSLAQEGIALKTKMPAAPYMVILGLILGSCFFWLTERIVSKHDTQSLETSQGFSKRSLLIFIVMFLHSIPEGIAIGVGFATGNMQFGLVMAIAISVHNIPEGIAISLPMKAENASTAKCAWASILSSVPQPIMAVPAAIGCVSGLKPGDDGLVRPLTELPASRAAAKARLQCSPRGVASFNHELSIHDVIVGHRR